jgi:hypothetical protein
MDPDFWRDIEHNQTYLDCEEMKRGIKEVCNYSRAMLQGNIEEAKKWRRLAMFCSDPGLGKTHLMRREVRRAGIKINRDDGINPGSRSDLCYQLWEEKRAGHGLTIFDDVDQPMRSEPMINILKSGWNKRGEGIIRCPQTHAIRINEQRRQAGDDRYEPSIPLPRYPFTLGHLWSANKRLDTRAARELNKCHREFEALVDRGPAPMWIDSQPRNVCLYTVWMIVEGKLLREMGLKVEEQHETLEFFMDAALKGHPRPNLRLAIDLAQARRQPEFQQAWAAIIRRTRDAVPDEPKALTKGDFVGKGRPDLLALIRAAHERKTTVEMPDEPADDERPAERPTAPETPIERRPKARQPVQTQTPYRPPPGHVFPPPSTGPIPPPPVAPAPDQPTNAELIEKTIKDRNAELIEKLRTRKADQDKAKAADKPDKYEHTKMKTIPTRN